MDAGTDTELEPARPPLRPRAFGRWMWRFARDVGKEYGDDGVGDLAASITFWTLLSIPAAVLALVSMLSSLERFIGESLADDLEQAVQDFVTDTFADSGALSDTVAELFNTPSAGVATIATLIAIFTLSRAFAGLIRALDIAYEVEDTRPFWYVRVVAMCLGLGTIAVVAAGATVLAVLPEIPYGTSFRWLIAPTVFASLIMWAATLYHVGPNHKTPWRYDLPGAVFTTLGWVAATQGYALYVRLTAGANNVQSTIGAVLLAFTLMYLLSLVLVIGAEINDVLARRAGVVQQVTSVTDRAREVRDQIRSRLDD